MRSKVVQFGGKEVRIDERRVGELEKLINELFPSSKGKLANIDLSKELAGLDINTLYAKLPIIAPELDKETIANAYMSEVEELVAAFVDVNFLGLKKVLTPLLKYAVVGGQTGLTPRR